MARSGDETDLLLLHHHRRRRRRHLSASCRKTWARSWIQRRQGQGVYVVG